MLPPENYFTPKNEGINDFEIVDFYFDGFVGVFETTYNTDYLIEYFKYCEQAGMVDDRQKSHDPERPKNWIKDSAVYLGFMASAQDNRVATASCTSRYFRSHQYLRSYMQLSDACYDLYSQKFEAVAEPKLNSIFVNVQRTRPSEGYHVFHSENVGNLETARRQLVTMLYLNDIEEGGETEFLYQSLRIKPKKGRFLIWPSDWTYTHRGNPPLKEDKYIATSWLELAI